MDLSILQHDAHIEQINRLHSNQQLPTGQSASSEKSVFGPAYVLSQKPTNSPDMPLYTASAVVQTPENEKSGSRSADGSRLSREDEAQLEKLEQRDAKVRAHEQAHVTAAGGQAGRPTYTYQTGPDGKRYAIGGSVNISIMSNGDDETSLKQARTAQRAAMVNGEASSADVNTANTARDIEARVRQHAVEQYARQQSPFGVF